MTRLLLFAALFVILPVALFSACGGDDDADETPIQLQQADRDRIIETATAYVAALKARDMTAAKDRIIKGVPEATIKKSMDTVEEEGFTFVAAHEPTADGQHVEILIDLKDKDGNSVTRKLEFRLDGGNWVVYSPHLKPLT